MEPMDPRPDVSTVELVKETVMEARELLKTEIALAKDEAQRQITEAKRVAIAMSTAAVTAMLGLATLLVAFVLAIAPRPLTALITGLVLLAMAAAAGIVGYTYLPKKPLEQTQERLQEDAQVLKESLV